MSEKTLQRLGDEDYEKVYLFPNSHAGYYPDALPIAMKMIFRKSDGRLLGAQAVGRDGVDKRIDALAVAIQLGGTIHDLEEAELCYAPQFGSAKSPANFAGMVAADVLCGDMPVMHWGDLDGEFLLDVRHPEELAAEALPGVVNIPVDQLRVAAGRAAARPRDRRRSAAPASAPTTRRASSCRTASTRASCPAGCCRTRSSRRCDAGGRGSPRRVTR